MNNGTQHIIDRPRATVTLKNMTNKKLQVKNNMISGLGPKKGQWIVHKEFIVHPHELIQTSFLPNETHQIMVYEIKPESFLYMIHDTDLEDGDSVNLFETNYDIIEKTL